MRRSTMIRRKIGSVVVSRIGRLISVNPSVSALIYMSRIPARK
jgi:hypothetical protein